MFSRDKKHKPVKDSRVQTIDREPIHQVAIVGCMYKFP
jgi:hypothetical protein